MTEIVLMRHGHALSAREAGVHTDSERPLSALGEKEAGEAFLHLKAAGFAPDLIISSPFLRADRTAELAARAFPAASRQTDHALSDGPVQDLLDLVLGLDQPEKRVLLVGHQPLIGAAAGFLLSGSAYDLSPAGFVRLKTGKEPGSRSLLEFYAPPGPEDERR